MVSISYSVGKNKIFLKIFEIQEKKPGMIIKPGQLKEKRIFS